MQKMVAKAQRRLLDELALSDRLVQTRRRQFNPLRRQRNEDLPLAAQARRPSILRRFPQHFYALFARHQHSRRNAYEQPVLDDAGDGV